MKKLLSLFFSILLITLAVAGCGSANKSNNDNSIIGKWEHVADGQTDSIEFLKNGKINVKTHNFSISGSYSAESIPQDGVSVTGNYIIDGNKVTLDYVIFGAKREMISTFTVNNSELTLTTGGTETNGIKTAESSVVFKRVN